MEMRNMSLLIYKMYIVYKESFGVNVFWTKSHLYLNCIEEIFGVL